MPPSARGGAREPNRLRSPFGRARYGTSGGAEFSRAGAVVRTSGRLMRRAMKRDRSLFDELVETKANTEVAR
jgi:hypothetical protein